MPIDPSIALQYRPVEIQNPLAQYAQIMQLQGAQTSNALANYQLSRAQREDEAAGAMDSAWRNAMGADGKLDRGRYLSAVPGRMGPDAMKRLQELDKSQGEIDAKTVETKIKQLGVVGGVMSQVRQAPSRANVIGALQNLKAQGLPDVDRALSSLPPDDAAIPQWIDQVIMGTEQGRKSLEAMLPKIDYVNSGGAQVPVNKNALAGPMGPAAGMAPIQNTLSPEGRAADARAAATLAETKRHHGVTESRERTEKPPTGYRWKGGVVGELEPIPGGPAGKDKALTEAQGKATGFSIRAREAADLLNELEAKGTFGRVASKVQATRESLDRVPVVGTALANVAEGALNTAVSGEQQKYDQAKRDFINGVLRVESGATITVPEFLNADRQYFPQAGDSQTVIEQKRKNREKAIQALMAQTGPGGEKVPKSRTIDAGGGWTIKRID